jgi:hypothetical protein
MNRVALVISGIVIGIAGTSFLFAPSVMSASADNYTMARAAAFVWEDGSSPPEGASEFCLQVYEGTRAEVTIIMTLLDGAEAIGAPIEEFYTVISTGKLVSVRGCFDEAPTNDPQGDVLSINDAQALLLSQPQQLPTTGDISQGELPATLGSDAVPDAVSDVVPEVVPDAVPDERDSGGCHLVTEEEAASQAERGWLLPQSPGLDCNDEHLIGCAASGSCPVGPAEEVARVTSLYVAGESQRLYAWIEQNAPGISLEEAAQLSPWGICAPSWMAPQFLSAAGVSLPTWISSRIIGYGDGQDCS